MVKEEIKLSLFPDDIVIYVENSKKFTKAFLELRNEFIKVTRYKINNKKNQLYLYILTTNT